MKILKRSLPLITLISGLILGWALFHKNVVDDTPVTNSDAEITYTCSMHPQIRQNEPGDCPICGMDLIPVGDAGAGTNMVEMSEEAVLLANIQTIRVAISEPKKKVMLQGKVVLDERRVNNQTAHLNGRIESLAVSFTGEYVRKGQRLATIYSPELVTAQRELFEAIKTKESNPALYNAARNKLKQWKLSDSQIDEIISNGEVLEEVVISADISGVVLERKVSVGDYVKEGGVLYTIADLSRVWIEFDAYETDLQWLRTGDSVLYTISSIPGSTFVDVITFIDPLIDPSTRTAAIRLEVDNSDAILKPEMFANGTVLAQLPIEEPLLTVPKSAVLWTGTRSVVYVAIQDAASPMFEFREVILGADLGSSYVITSGLEEGEFVVTNGAFKVDAAAQLSGMTSMMNREEEPDQMDMEGMAEASFMVKGNCGMCKTRIEEAATSLEGVEHASWSADDQLITIHYNEDVIDPEKVGLRIAEVGHDTEYGTASDEVYESLPGCCLYIR